MSTTLLPGDVFVSADGYSVRLLEPWEIERIRRLCLAALDALEATFDV